VKRPLSHLPSGVILIMNVETLLFIPWVAIPFCLSLRFRWLGVAVGMPVLWAVYCVSLWPARQLFQPRSMFSVTGFVSFSVLWFVLYAVKATLFSKKSATRWCRWLVVGVASAMALSFFLGIADVCLVSFDKAPIFVKEAEYMLLDGGTTEHVGFGYSLVCHRRMLGEQGPVISYWFLPFEICCTTERTGIRWIF
jgi:hypothetical protein